MLKLCTSAGVESSSRDISWTTATVNFQTVKECSALTFSWPTIKLQPRHPLGHDVQEGSLFARTVLGHVDVILKPATWPKIGWIDFKQDLQETAGLPPNSFRWLFLASYTMAIAIFRYRANMFSWTCAVSSTLHRMVYLENLMFVIPWKKWKKYILLNIFASHKSSSKELEPCTTTRDLPTQLPPSRTTSSSSGASHSRSPKRSFSSRS